VLHLVKKNPETEAIPFIFLTAKAERGDFRRGMEMGADDYISKPFDDIELLSAIEMRLKKFDIIHSKFAAGEKGANEMLQELNSAGIIGLDPESYEAQLLAKKMNLYHAGTRPKFLFYVKKGKIKTFLEHEDGKEYITNLYSPGDFFGYIPLLEGTNYEDNAEVLEEAEVARIPAEEFLAVIYRDMNIASKFIKLISREIKEKEERLLNLAYDSLRKRVAKALVAIHTKFNSQNPGPAQLDISREDIAQYVGTATESLIRTLSDFKSEKLIEIKEGKIRILDLAKLSNLIY
jgi:CRP-like cAMP-binding protein